MQISGIPTKFNIPFGNGAGSGYIRPIPQASQIGITDGAASLTDGFPPLNFLPIGAGGVPPFGQDMNGILKQITQWSQWQQAGGPAPYDATFQAQVGGYPAGAIVESLTTPLTFWISTADSNTSNPDAAGAGWAPWPSTASVVAAGGIANVQMFSTTARVSMSGSAGNSYTVTPWSGTYIKQNAASRILAMFAAPTFAPSPTAATGAALLIGAGSVQQASSNNTSADARGQTAINGLFSGAGVGAVAWSVQYSRFDATAWSTIFCCNSADNASLPPATTATLILGEIK